MARPSRNRDHTLLGHAPRDPFASGDKSPHPPYRNSDVYFSDVFGGPPRRSSVGHTRLEPGESAGGRGGWVGEEAAAPRRPWSCSLGEKPVFGGIGSPARRTQERDGFFDDIFGANESASSTPRKMDRDLFSSNPGSRVLSPARPLPSASDVISRGSALPPRSSLFTRPFEVSDRPAYGSHTTDVAYRSEKNVSDVFISPPIACAPNNCRRLVQPNDNQKNDAHASYNESALDRSLEATRLASIESNDTERQLKRDSSGLQAYSDGGYFHFSMYKWASIGVTLVMPHNLKERTKSGTKVSGVSVQVSQSAVCPTDNQNMPQGHGIFHNQCDLEDESLLSGLAAEENHDINLTKEVKKVVHASSDTKSVRSDITDKSDDIDTCSKDDASVAVKAWKSELTNIPQLLNDYSDKGGEKERARQRRNKESMVGDYSTKMNDARDAAKVDQTISENMLLSDTGKSVKKMCDTIAAREGKMVGSRVKGKVKEFIKIFNQEPAPRSGGTVENQARRPTTRHEAREGLEMHVSARVVDADEHEKEKVENEALLTPLSPLAANQNLGIGEIPASVRFLSKQKTDDSSLEAKGASSDRIPDILGASFHNIKEAYIDNIDECLMEELHQNQNEVTEADVQQDEIKKSDAKIREWSKGKERNIRSLLSTLQYVLWPGSGWKPVPLVDIIEGTSVRKAYQKALLCLHPDKLQQKGVKMHQKYIAEKVFDILQEAWIHFNSVSSL